METSLTSVLARMLRVPDMWTAFADRYLEALDAAVRTDAVAPKRIWRSWLTSTAIPIAPASWYTTA